MTGRGRGRGTLAKWEAGIKSVGDDSFRSRDSEFSGFSKENWEDEVKLEKQNEPRDTSNIRVTHVIDVEHFWAQVGSSEELKQFDKYMDALNAWCDQQGLPSKGQQMPVCGQPVCVKHTVANQWRRAQVTRLSNSMVDVFYLDYGQVECVPSERLCSSTPSDFMAKPALAQYITLEGVQPVNGKWSGEANDRFGELVSSTKTLTVHLSDTCRGTLFLRNSRGKDISVGDILISEGYAKTCSESLKRTPWELNIRSGTQETRENSVDKLDQQRSAVSINPPSAAQPAWKTTTAIPTVQEVESYYTAKNLRTDSPFSSKEKSLSAFQPVFNPPQFRAHNEPCAKQDTSEISSSVFPTPSDLESGKLETFNIKKTEQVGTEVLRTAKPYLASPKEFLSHFKGQEKQVVKGELLESKNEVPPKYQQPHIRSQPAKNKETPSTIEPKNTQHLPAETSTNSSNNQDPNSQRSSKSFASVTTSSSLLQNVHPPYSSFTFWPKPGRSNIAAQFQSNFFNKDVTQTTQQGPNPNVPQQTEFLKTQPLSENTRDKTLKAEVEWKVWKFQRNIRGILNRMASGNDQKVIQDLEKTVTESRLSRDFPGISEVFIVLELLVERVLDKGQFDDIAVKVLIVFRDMSVPQLSDHVSKVLRRGQQELIEQCDVSDCHKKWRRFSLFLGKLYLEVLNEVEPTGLKSAVDAFVANSLHNWMSFDQAEPVALHELKAISLKSFLKVVGPTIDQIEGNEISRYFTTIRELVLSRDLSQEVKSILLDTLLLRAANWTAEDDTDQQETGSLSTEDEVFVEKEEDNNDDDDDDDSNDDDVEIEDAGEEWDPYFKVKAMLKSLKLEDLLPKFFENCIRDSLLGADWEELKRTLQEASFPPGVILEIRMYLDKGVLGKEAAGGSKEVPRTKGKELASNKAQRRKDDSTPTTSVDHSIEINKLTDELQQLMCKDSIGASTATARKISPQREPAGHEGTPYSRGGPRKFVSRAERRHSSETQSEDVPSQLTGTLSRRPESVGPPSVVLVDPLEFGTSSAAAPEKQSGATMSYSAALKTSPPELTKSGTPSDSKSKTLSRPPPGLSPLPTHGGDTEMHMTVLGSKTRTRPSGGGGGTRRKSPTRADVSLNWRTDKVNEHGAQASARHTSSSPSSSGHGLKWRRFDEAWLGKPRSGNSNNGAPRRDDSGVTNSRESAQPPPVVQPHRAFGPGGLKACVICGSKDHLRCNNRSKLFLD